MAKAIDLLPEIKKMSLKYGIDWKMLAAFIKTETGGRGFDEATGKLIIQFEPAWFRKKAPYAPSGLWSVNKVDVQAKEWKAFNDAFSKNADAAMQATSIGIGQIMGFNYKLLGFDSVGAMWDNAKQGIEQQIDQICKFIIGTPAILAAIIRKNWEQIATIYNGKGYKEIARKYGRKLDYAQEMEKWYNLFKQIE